MSQSYQEIADARMVEIKRLRTVCHSKDENIVLAWHKLNRIALDKNTPENISKEILAISEELHKTIG
ncbi:MAG TPA: hypothetical protein PKW61_00100 [Tenuifilaceae bacterium]|nr:hypothetical protein [Tenuifilaceae bacterium]